MMGQTKTRLLGVAVLVAMFAVGGLTGAVVQRSATASARESSRPPRGPSLFETLQLTTEQQAQVCSIVHRRAEQIKPYNEAMKSFWEEQAPSVRAIITAANAEMDSVLTPEQRAKKDEFRAERERYFKERQQEMQRSRDNGDRRNDRGDHGGRGPGGPGGMGNPLGVSCERANG
jgi:Spy/CpxP family protein refolding chaperone